MKRQMLKDFRDMNSNTLIITTKYADYRIFKIAKNEYIVKTKDFKNIFNWTIDNCSYKELEKAIEYRIKNYEFDSWDIESF